MQNDISWVDIATNSGAIVFVTIFIQFVKPLFPNLNTRLMVLLTSIFVTQLTVVFMGTSSLSNHFLALFNAIYVALGCMGTYELSFKKIDDARKSEFDEGGAESGETT